MNELFVDTAGWLAVFNPRDTYHRPAADFYRAALRNYRRLLTTNLVVGETYALLGRRRGVAVGLRFLEVLSQSPKLEKLCSTPPLEEAAREWLSKYRDQDFSFVDAVSFALMQERGIAAAFTFDGHFQVAGFSLLP
ncbi:MAG: type II toxin-antitoxin system VapC family toxin [Vulcanimicrobiota bacterium]